ncbi:MAG: 16S rRNA (guanine(527)-N(7))-methyltransferase RsmG [Chitinophagales bacterium]|nr:16S rRNA (guanine(527)-N(7))-methyltransferase RsmG [Chitinophagales bacterium]MDW8419601.1 16S rRNA (guanine(527)-N(7))-methyltransferase RsmG [Chitinophagales bacterium]
MDVIRKYFPELSSAQLSQFGLLHEVYTQWNDKINVISRKDIQSLYEHHVLHSLAIARFVSFLPGAKVMDLGTGGGIPGIPLAIYFPEARFHLVDSVGKKLRVVEAVCDACGIKNIFTFHCRAEEMKYQYDFIVTRAVAPLNNLLRWTKGKFLSRNRHAIANGLIALKGGNIEDEIAAARIPEVIKVPLVRYFSEDYYKEKVLVYVPAY